ncbi:uncharacterized protein [Typha angustifolia]|uniref:uncharacterized protein n=1 Tax=Typha angustifolia TaxID=59011 RepID=UPI003C2C43A0
MGNTASCTPCAVYPRPAKVIGNDGLIEEYAHTVRVAELMFDNPGQFVCDSDHLNVGCRIPGLAADDELEQHHVYFLLPMDMLYSVLTEEEMSTLSCRASGAVRKSGSKKNNIVKTIPTLGDFCLFPPETKQVEEPNSSVSLSVRMSRQRSWIPALDTIEEVP